MNIFVGKLKKNSRLQRDFYTYIGMICSSVHRKGTVVRGYCTCTTHKSVTNSIPIMVYSLLFGKLSSYSILHLPQFVQAKGLLADSSW